MTEVVKMKKILLVEDDESFGRYLLRVLRKAKFERVDFSSDPEEAIKLAENNHYHIIISDIMLPKMNGFEMAKTIIKKLKLKTKFIFISGFVNSITDPDESLRENSVFISKPFPPDVLLKAINDIYN